MKTLKHDVLTNKITEVDLTAEEISQREADIAEHKEKETAFKNSLTEKTNLKASAKAKLVAGEPLTEAEADTLVI